jgi:hypothetical protein
VISYIEDAVVEHWSLLGLWPGAELVDEGGILRFETPIPALPYSAVLRTRLDGDAGAAIAAMTRLLVETARRAGCHRRAHGERDGRRRLRPPWVRRTLHDRRPRQGALWPETAERPGRRDTRCWSQLGCTSGVTHDAPARRRWDARLAGAAALNFARKAG